MGGTDAELSAPRPPLDAKGCSYVNTVAVFTWRGQLPSDEEVGADPATRYSRDFGEQWAYQACRPVAIALLEAVRNLGHRTDDVPYFGEHGWHFNVELERKNYSMMVLWVARGSRNDCFAVQPSLRQGCIPTLFLPQPRETALGPACAALQAALTAHRQIADVEWVEKIYLRGRAAGRAAGNPGPKGWWPGYDDGQESRVAPLSLGHGCAKHIRGLMDQRFGATRVRRLILLGARRTTWCPEDRCMERRSSQMADKSNLNFRVCSMRALRTSSTMGSFMAGTPGVGLGSRPRGIRSPHSRPPA